MEELRADTDDVWAADATPDAPEHSGTVGDSDCDSAVDDLMQDEQVRAFIDGLVQDEQVVDVLLDNTLRGTVLQLTGMLEAMNKRCEDLVQANQQCWIMNHYLLQCLELQLGRHGTEAALMHARGQTAAHL